MARPSSLIPELRETIERELADGIPIVVVAQDHGVGRSALHEWISRERPKSVVTDLAPLSSSGNRQS